MGTEAGAMWMPAEGLMGASGQLSEQVSTQAFMQENSAMTGPASLPRRRSWIPLLDRMPPLVQFVLHAAQWCRAKCVPGAKQGAQLRLVGQLALGAKRHLSLVEVGGYRFLVGGGTEHVTVIVPIPAEALGNAAEADDSGRELCS
ncbi:MAG: flagellar biosynthetic protein FliO [Acidobacteriaceae bacterium]